MIDLTPVHEEVLQFLSAKMREKNLFFSMRKRIDEKMRNGIWFDGGENSVVFSFWEGTDAVAKRARISLIVSENKISENLELHVYLNARDSKDFAAIFEVISQALGGYTKYYDSKNKKTENQWLKRFPDCIWQEAIEKFLREDKPLIDSILRISQKDNMDAQKLFEIDKKSFLDIYWLNVKSVREGYFKERLQKEEAERAAEMQKEEERKRAEERERKRIKSLKVKSLRLQNIGHFVDIELPEIDDRIAVLIGKNGSGKSTFLRALALALTGISVFQSEELETEKFYLKDSELLNWLKLIDANVPVYAQEAKITLSYTFDEKPYQNVITLKKDENEKFPYAEESGDFATLRDINTKNGIQRHLSSLTIALPQGFGQNISAKFEDRIYPNAIQLLNIIKDTSPNRLALAKWIELYDFKHKEKGTPTSNWSEAIRHLFEIISKITLSEDEDGKEIGKVEFLKTAKTDSGNTRILVKTPDNTGGIDLNLLSLGYQNLFYWVGSLLSALYRFKDYATEEAEYEEYGKADVKNLPAVVIIDEIDTYLNADWQANILRVLYEEFPNIQFIVTTHSDLVLSGFDNEKIHIITPNEVFSPRNNTYGLDRTRVSVFTGTQIRFPKIQKWIEEADNFIENNDFSAAEAKIRELKNANPLISDILRLEAQIRNRKS